MENEKDKLKDAEDVAHEKQAENLHLQQELETERLHSQSLIAKHDADLAHMKSCIQENESYIEQLTRLVLQCCFFFWFWPQMQI